MNKVFYLDHLKPGDRIVVPKSNLRLIQHHAIYIGKDHLGQRLYIENAIGQGVQLITESYLFRDGYNLTRIEPFTGNEYQRRRAVEIALKMIGHKYDLINFNCEHYANSVQYNNRYSKQVGNGVIFGVLAFLFGIGFTR